MAMTYEVYRSHVRFPLRTVLTICLAVWAITIFLPYTTLTGVLNGIAIVGAAVCVIWAAVRRVRSRRSGKREVPPAAL